MEQLPELKEKEDSRARNQNHGRPGPGLLELLAPSVAELRRKLRAIREHYGWIQGGSARFWSKLQRLLQMGERGQKPRTKCYPPAVAEFEHGIIKERVNAGIAAARMRGVKFGRPGKHTWTVADLRALKSVDCGQCI
jgi:hypothetical protein